MILVQLGQYQLPSVFNLDKGGRGHRNWLEEAELSWKEIRFLGLPYRAAQALKEKEKSGPFERDVHTFQGHQVVRALSIPGRGEKLASFATTLGIYIRLTEQGTLSPELPFGQFAQMMQLVAGSDLCSNSPHMQGLLLTESGEVLHAYVKNQQVNVKSVSMDAVIRDETIYPVSWLVEKQMAVELAELERLKKAHAKILEQSTFRNHELPQQLVDNNLLRFAQGQMCQ